MRKKGVVWPLSPHTAAKHAILRRYLEAWFPILGSWAQRIGFIDGFAGPGEYAGGEPGSPLIALDVVTRHKSDFSKRELVFLFVEADKKAYAHLKDLLDRTAVPAYVKWQAVPGTFADTVGMLLDAIEKKGSQLAPVFVMIDPFGPSGVPMNLVRRIAAKPRSELLISFMYEPISRWRNQPTFATHLDALFGTPDWRLAEHKRTPDERKAYLLDLYMTQLAKTGMAYRRAFEMMDAGNRTEYFLIYATRSLKGLKAMKDAMWKVDPSGGVQFSDATASGQMTLFTAEPDYGLLKRQILSRFAGQQVSVEELEEFVLAETAFRETHYKRQVLRPMEEAGELVVLESVRKRPYTYPPGTVIKFA